MEDKIDLQFTASENNEWRFHKYDSPVSHSDQLLDTPSIISSCAFYDILENHMAGGTYALSIEDGLLLVKWVHEPHHIIGCCESGDYTTDEIVEYFSVFDDLYSFSD